MASISVGINKSAKTWWRWRAWRHGMAPAASRLAAPLTSRCALRMRGFSARGIRKISQPALAPGDIGLSASMAAYENSTNIIERKTKNSDRQNNVARVALRSRVFLHQLALNIATYRAPSLRARFA
jgi:hypothetical protein